MPMQSETLIVNRADTSETEIVTAPLPPLAEGEARLRVDRFALSANNITYAMAPDQFGYWAFFPTARQGWGIVPVWGFGEVIESRHPELATGRRVYGYLPMSTHLTIHPGEVTKTGMRDMAEHRQPMSPIYNSYTDCAQDPLHDPDAEGVISLFRPVFTTSFLLADDLSRNAMFGATQIVLTSASSKTAMGLAFCLRKAGTQGAQVVGLTSGANRDFVVGTGLYDAVLSYDAAADLAQKPTALVDMAGNGALRVALHRALGDNMVHSAMVGLTHWSATHAPPADLPGAKPAFFFAPDKARACVKDWGHDGFQSRLADVWSPFLIRAKDWTRLRTTTGAAAIKAEFDAMRAGNIDPGEGVILSFDP